MLSVRQLAITTTATVLAAAAAAGVVGAQQRNDKAKDDVRRPKLSLRAQPQMVVAPARVTLTAEITGGPDDFEEFYCPSVEWAWGDDTSSESTADCNPYEAGKSQIKRRYTTQHLFRRSGTFKVYFHLKQKDRILGSASTTIQVQPGLGNPSGPF